MCDTFTAAVAAQWVAALSVNDFVSARKLFDELKKRVGSVKPDPHYLEDCGDDEAYYRYAAEQLRPEV